jgi:hypothetical protein
MSIYKPCPSCGEDAAEKVSFTWWGGLIGPMLLSHVRCRQCGTTYNGKSGKSNNTNIVLYMVIPLAVVVVAVLGICMLGACGSLLGGGNN